METKKYRLKSLYPGLTALIKEGDTVKQDVCGNYLVKDTVIFINRYDVEDYPDFWEEIIESTPIGKTSESYIYWDGVDSDVFEDIEVWSVYGERLQICYVKYPKVELEIDAKLFLTQQAAEDYVKLQKAIKRAVALDKSTVDRYYVSVAGECIVKMDNFHDYLSWYSELKINPYDCELSKLTQTIELLTKIKEERK